PPDGGGAVRRESDTVSFQGRPAPPSLSISCRRSSGAHSRSCLYCATDRFQDLLFGREPNQTFPGNNLSVNQDAELASPAFFQPWLDSQVSLDCVRRTGGPWQVRRSYLAIANDYILHNLTSGD